MGIVSSCPKSNIYLKYFLYSSSKEASDPVRTCKYWNLSRRREPSNYVHSEIRFTATLRKSLSEQIRSKFTISLRSNLGRPSPNVTWTLNDSELMLDQMTTSSCSSSPSSSTSPLMSVSMSVTPPSLVVSRLRSSCIPRWHRVSVTSCHDHDPLSGVWLGQNWAVSPVTTTSPFPPSPRSTSMFWVSTKVIKYRLEKMYVVDAWWIMLNEIWCFIVFNSKQKTSLFVMKPKIWLDQ